MATEKKLGRLGTMTPASLFLQGVSNIDINTNPSVYGDTLTHLPSKYAAQVEAANRELDYDIQQDGGSIPPVRGYPLAYDTGDMEGNPPSPNDEGFYPQDIIFTKQFQSTDKAPIIIGDEFLYYTSEVPALIQPSLALGNFSRCSEMGGNAPVITEFQAYLQCGKSCPPYTCENCTITVSTVDKLTWTLRLSYTKYSRNW